ncbi:MAG: hypothetical protein KIT11_06995 [Fimbriimonadaceae bacterium]|nr:hypothetical protein [Fimbriimonadaceae bacterium]QYK56098.1 MAG: hypothetical protein KF733_01185 [Fimbriimonadaceae bacterium]
MGAQQVTSPEPRGDYRPARGLGLTLNEARAAADVAFEFAEEIGVDTYDPFDTKGSQFVMWTYRSRTPLHTLLRKAVFGLELFAPIGVRQLLRCEKRRSAGGVARFSQAHLARYALTRESRHLDAARGLLQWLAQNPGTAGVGKGWGLPFEWQAFVVVPAGTAIGHTTMAVANALLDFHDATGEAWAKAEAEEACRFLTEGLNQTERPSGSVALSYTPLDWSQVMNTNAEIAALLLRNGDPAHFDLAQRLTQFVLETQNEGGSWFYSAPDAGEGRQVIDHYHTGMILTALLETVGTLDDQNVVRALNLGLSFHLGFHFEKDGCPKMRPHTRWPIDAYSAGESVLTLVRAVRSPWVEAKLRARAVDTLHRLVGYIVRDMMYGDGGFIYRRWPLNAMRIDSMRWAQALLCQGLAEYCLARGADALAPAP